MVRSDSEVANYGLVTVFVSLKVPVVLYAFHKELSGEKMAIFAVESGQRGQRNFECADEAEI